MDRPTGRRNFDFVTMDDYAADTKELAERGAAIALNLRRQLDDALRMLWLAVRAAGGRVEIHSGLIADFDPKCSILEVHDRPENCAIVVKANIDAGTAA